MDSIAQNRPDPESQLDSPLEAELSALEQAMPILQQKAGNVFVLAQAWADRHDAIIEAALPESRDVVEARLRRIGIRWGMMDGARMTQQFPALPPEEPRKK